MGYMNLSGLEGIARGLEAIGKGLVALAERPERQQDYALTPVAQNADISQEKPQEPQPEQHEPNFPFLLDDPEGGHWEHCSPALIGGGLSCGKTLRRACRCKERGSHDHWVPDVIPAKQEWEVAAGRIGMVMSELPHLHVAGPELSHFAERRESMIKALLWMMNQPQLTQGGNTGMILSNFVRRCARNWGIDLSEEVMKRGSSK